MLRKVNNLSELDGLQEYLSVDRDRAVADYSNMQLSTAFQPLVSLSHQRIVGYEALLRGVNASGIPLNVAEIFSVSRQNGQHVFVDRLLNVLHLKNAELQNLNDYWICLNISPHAILESSINDVFYEQCFSLLGVKANRVVIEIVETPIYGEDRLADACSVFKDLGCLVAIDDFGAGHSNFERIWKIKPDLVKFDRATIVHAERDMTVRRSLPGLVSLFHEAGCLVAIEGVDNREQVFIALDADVDFVQGHLFSKPLLAAPQDSDLGVSLNGLLKDFKCKNDNVYNKAELTLQGYIEKFQCCAERIAKIDSIENACRPFLNEPLVQRCFLINSDGIQIGEAIEAPDSGMKWHAKFAPLSLSAGADWYRRQYYRSAIRNPNQVQVSNPYLSRSDARYCITLSIRMEIGTQVYVLCADIDGDTFCR